MGRCYTDFRVTDSRKGKTGLEWLLREADAKPQGAETIPAAPGSVPAPSAPEPWAKTDAPAPSAAAADMHRKNANRRTSPRVKVTFEVRYKKGSEQITATGANVSLGGFFFETKKFLPLGDVFQAQLVFPVHANRRLAVIAEVIHAGDDGIGAKFLDVDDKDRPFLAELVASNPPLDPPTS